MFVAVLAVEPVATGRPDEQVVSGIAIRNRSPTAADEPVIAERPDEGRSARAADEHVVECPAARPFDTGQAIGRAGTLGVTRGEVDTDRARRPAVAGQVELTCARNADPSAPPSSTLRPGPPESPSGSRPSVEAVVTTGTEQHVGAGSATHDVVASPGDDAVVSA